MTMRRRVTILLAGLCAFAAPAGAQPAPPPPPPPPGLAPVAPPVSAPSTFAFQIGGGYLSSGTVFIEGFEATSSGGPLGTLAIDSLVAPRMSLGLFAVGAHTEVGDIGANVATFGGTIKARFGSPSGVQLRVGVAFGLQLITLDEDEDGSEMIKGFDVAPIVEVAFPSSGSLSFVLQASALSQPAGGNADVEVTFAPISYVAALLEFR